MRNSNRAATVVFLSLALILLLSALYWFASSPVQSLPDASPPPDASGTALALPLIENASEADGLDKMYIVKEKDGYIAVYDAENGETPIFMTDTRTEKLRQSDREKIRKGVSVYGYENLVSLLEDFEP